MKNSFELGNDLARKYQVNNKMNSINTEHDAYWLGFLYADGMVTKDNNIVCTLKSDDIEHLEKMKKYFDCTYNIKIIKHGKENSYEGAMLKMTDAKLASNLISYGCIPNKSSLNIGFPFEIFKEKQNLIRHFIRGYFDGDGSIYIDAKNKVGINMIGCTKLITEINSIIKISNSVYKEKRCAVETSYISTTAKNKILNFYELLYNDATIYLQRKYDKFQMSFKQFEDNEEKKMQNKILLIKENYKKIIEFKTKNPDILETKEICRLVNISPPQYYAALKYGSSELQ